MKRKIVFAVLGLLFTAWLSGCTAWEDNWNECIPLPGADGGITPDPWEPEDNPLDPVGN